MSFLLSQDAPWVIHRRCKDRGLTPVNVGNLQGREMSLRPPQGRLVGRFYLWRKESKETFPHLLHPLFYFLQCPGLFRGSADSVMDNEGDWCLCHTYTLARG